MAEESKEIPIGTMFDKKNGATNFLDEAGKEFVTFRSEVFVAKDADKNVVAQISETAPNSKGRRVFEVITLGANGAEETRLAHQRAKDPSGFDLTNLIGEDGKVSFPEKGAATSYMRIEQHEGANCVKKLAIDGEYVKNWAFLQSSGVVKARNGEALEDAGTYKDSETSKGNMKRTCKMDDGRFLNFAKKPENKSWGLMNKAKLLAAAAPAPEAAPEAAATTEAPKPKSKLGAR